MNKRFKTQPLMPVYGHGLVIPSPSSENLGGKIGFLGGSFLPKGPG